MTTDDAPSAPAPGPGSSLSPDADGSPSPAGRAAAPDEQARTVLGSSDTVPMSTGRPATTVALSGSAAAADDEAPAPRGVRWRTVVFGLVLLTLSGTSLLRLLTDVHVDDAAVLLTILIAAGALLLGGGVVAAVREARGDRRSTP